MQVVKVIKFFSGTLYTVGNGGQLQQVMTPNESSAGLTAVTVDGATQESSRYAYYPAVQTGETQQGGRLFNPRLYCIVCVSLVWLVAWGNYPLER